MLRCSEPTVRRWVRSGTLNAFRLVLSGPWLFRRDDVLRQLTPVPVASSSSSSTGSSSNDPPTAVGWGASLAGSTHHTGHK